MVAERWPRDGISTTSIDQAWGAYTKKKEVDVKGLSVEECDNLAERIHWSADTGMGTPVRIVLDAFYRFLDHFRPAPKEIQ